VSFDTSRFTFDPRKDYSGVVMQQGRVQLDADWNEWLAELVRRTQAGTLDLLDRAAYPATTPFAFQIAASTGPGGTKTLTIGPGRMYVDGLLAENHGDPAAARWDPALAEMSNTPQPPPGTMTGAIDFTEQPYMPPGTPLPSGTGPFLAYLDVWMRPVDYLNDPGLIDKAVGVDSTGRLQTVWQVRLLDLPNLPGVTCDSAIANWPPAPSAGLLSTGTTPTAPSGPCCLTSGAAYTGLENQFYRVQVHQPGAAEASAVPPAAAPAGATFIWSRDNGSVVTGVTSINSGTNSAGKPASQLTVVSLGRDQVLGFAPGNWIEIMDDASEFAQKAGELHQIDTVDVSAKVLTLVTTLGSSFATGTTDPKLHTRIRRWDQSGKVFEQDGTTVWWDIDAEGRADIPVPPAGTALVLENGITVSFDVSASGGLFVAGDFWTFAARTADGSVETLDKAAPRGIHHHYARLSIVTFPSGATDCRTKWPPSTSDSECGCCCTCTVGDGVESFGQYASINDAIKALPDTGGEVCILPGRYFENVLILGRRDVVLRGCGWQTRIASAALKAPAAPVAGVITVLPPGSTFNAVITVTQSAHVKLLSFAVEAAPGEVGILIDGAGTLSAGAAKNAGTPLAGGGKSLLRAETTDVTLEDLIVTASTLPAILANRVVLLHVERNRVAMEDVPSQWPAVWISGTEMRVVHNWLGTQTKAVTREWLPATVTMDLEGDAVAGAPAPTGFASKVPLHPGGIQIAGTSTDVFIVENEIDGAGRNGITLGSVSIIGTDGRPKDQVTGVTVQIPGPCDTTITLTIPGTTTGGQGGDTVVASGSLRNIQINRNRIRNTGLCGIGPVGFFNLAKDLEVISIQNLTIAGNTIASTLQADLAEEAAGNSTFGYGAICMPSVETLVIRDNNITDFGRRPGDPACGIFVLHGEMVEISRNRVLETRDWARPQDEPPPSGPRGGILLMLVTPPSLQAPGSFTITTTATTAGVTPVYLPNLPALRVEHNSVRVALGLALEVVGYGPFSIVNNHLASGGAIRARAGRPVAQTVVIFNLALSIESETLAATFTNLNQGFTVSTNLAQGVVNPSCGAVIFTNNTCQLEARQSQQQCFASVLILALDDLIFGHNECWLDGPPLTAVFDALLGAGSLQVTSNRFQESVKFPVLASGFTLGALNITSQNISTYCLFATGTLQPAIANNNLSLIPASICREAAKGLQLSVATT
jgi:Family of unknown function (DUF6519)/Right handed beta helix region